LNIRRPKFFYDAIAALPSTEIDLRAQQVDDHGMGGYRLMYAAVRVPLAWAIAIMSPGSALPWMSKVVPVSTGKCDNVAAWTVMPIPRECSVSQNAERKALLHDALWSKRAMNEVQW
jgi:hypothetical protein